MDMAWMTLGNCQQEHIGVFFPSDGIGVRRAQQVCEGCPVQATCLDYAIDLRIEHGVWGGKSERQRQRIRRAKRGANAAQAS